MIGNRKQSANRKIIALQDQGSLNPYPKVADFLFLNEDFFDPNDIVQVKYELLRRVQIEGASITDTVKNFGFSRLSFYRILSALALRRGGHRLRRGRRGDVRGIGPARPDQQQARNDQRHEQDQERELEAVRLVHRGR